MGLFEIFKKKRVEVAGEEMNSAPVQETVVEPAAFSVPTGEFKMTVEDVFTITGRGTVVTGHVESGSVQINDTVLINGSRPVVVTGIEMFRKTLDVAVAGDNCGILLRDVTRDEISQGDVLSK